MEGNLQRIKRVSFDVTGPFEFYESQLQKIKYVFKKSAVAVSHARSDLACLETE